MLIRVTSVFNCIISTSIVLCFLLYVTGFGSHCDSEKYRSAMKFTSSLTISISISYLFTVAQGSTGFSAEN